MSGDVQSNAAKQEAKIVAEEACLVSLPVEASGLDGLGAMQARLSGWSARTEALNAVFTPEEAALLDVRRRAVDLTHATAVYVSFENPWGRCDHGSDLAVLLTAALEQQGLKTRRLSFLHHNLSSAPAAEELSCVGDFRVAFEDKQYHAEIYEIQHAGSAWWLIGSGQFLRADGGLGAATPFLYRGEDMRMRGLPNTPSLLRDSLFACKAVPAALQAMGLTQDLIIHLQDCEMAPALLTVKEAMLGERPLIESAAVVLCASSPVDRKLPLEQLKLISGHADDRHWPALDGASRPTTFGRMAPLADAPVIVPGMRFAQALEHDQVLARCCTAPLHGIFHYQGLAGITPGRLLAERIPPFSDLAMNEAAEGKVERILIEKQYQRSMLLHRLDEFCVSSQGAPGKEVAAAWRDLPPSTPIFAVRGLVDPVKGGLSLALLRDLEEALLGLARQGAAAWVVALEGVSAAAADLCVGQINAAKQLPGRGLVLISPPPELRSAVLAGASWTIFPSLFDSSRGVEESYAAGTPVMAPDSGNFRDLVRGLEDGGETTGLLDRCVMERLEHALLSFQAVASFPAGGLDYDLHASRRSEEGPLENAFFLPALRRATAIFEHEPQVYGRLLANLHRWRMDRSWDLAGAEVLEVYRCAVR